MIYHTYKALELSEKYATKYSIVYDKVIRYRAYRLWADHILECYKNKINTLYTPTSCFGIMNNEIFFGDLFTMSLMCKQFLFLDFLYESGMYHKDFIIKRWMETTRQNRSRRTMVILEDVSLFSFI
jgi:hypothetical protein